MARRGDEMQPEALEIVEGVVQRVDFQLAAVAGARHRPRGSKASGRAACGDASSKRGGELRKRRVVGLRRRLGERPADDAFEEGSAHGGL